MNRRGFSLIEVVLALTLAMFGGVTLLGLLSYGVQQVASQQLEARATPLASLFFATLRNGPFEAVPCFGQTLDLSLLDGERATVRLYGDFPAEGTPKLSAKQGPETYCVLEARFAPVDFAGRRGVASRVTLRIHPLGKTAAEGLRFETMIGNLR